VWCHDYHLMCLPEFLKEMDCHMKVGWFLHTPFPSSEIYRTLPLRSELLKAVLTADLIGWVPFCLSHNVIQTRSLWCEVPGQWKSKTYLVLFLCATRAILFNTEKLKCFVLSTTCSGFTMFKLHFDLLQLMM